MNREHGYNKFSARLRMMNGTVYLLNKDISEDFVKYGK